MIKERTLLPSASVWMGMPSMRQMYYYDNKSTQSFSTVTPWRWKPDKEHTNKKINVVVSLWDSAVSYSTRNRYYFLKPDHKNNFSQNGIVMGLQVCGTVSCWISF